MTRNSRRLGVSKVRTFRSCPLRWRWLYADEVERDTAKFYGWRFGTAVHAGLEAAFAWVKANHYVGPMHAPHIVKIAIDAATKSAIAEGCEARSIPTIVGHVVDYLAEAHHVAASDLLNVEEVLYFTVRRKDEAAGVPGVQAVGFADRIDRVPGPHATVEIIDYKAGDQGGLTPEDVRNDLQGEIYTVAAAQRFPWARRVVFTLAFTGSRTKVSVSRTSEEIAFLRRRLERELAQDSDQMEDGPWLPVESEHGCRVCEFRGACPLKNPDAPVPVAKGGEPAYDPRPDMGLAPKVEEVPLWP